MCWNSLRSEGVAIETHRETSGDNAAHVRANAAAMEPPVSLKSKALLKGM
jgi:hypothetical protein